MSAFGAEGANLMSDPADTYRIAENDPMLWLENAECLRLSAQLSWDGMQKIMRRSPAEGDIRMRQLAYVHSFMLLTAHAFENLCRGISVARKEDWRLLIGDKGGHALKKHVLALRVCRPTSHTSLNGSRFICSGPDATPFRKLRRRMERRFATSGETSVESISKIPMGCFQGCAAF